ncbi:hypothetical protein BGX24_002594 [Mortierella sp. AD032]|nr:hypothetical protein BGX24_002594 [Mortierella sp. AD032]
MASPRKIGILVAIPIKGRKLVNRSGGKQSPYIQLTLSSQKKRTKASLIASVEPEWDQEVFPPKLPDRHDLLLTFYLYIHFWYVYDVPVRMCACAFLQVRLDVFQGMLNMGVSVFDEGKKNELIGEGTLLLHEVIDKGELDGKSPLSSLS